MAETSTLRNFLVSLGYKVDGSSERVFISSLAATAKRAAELGVAIAAMAAGPVDALAKVADGMEKLYFSSQRTGVSVRGLRSMQFAASQLGSSAGDALTSIEALSKKMRESQGYTATLKSFGVETPGGHLSVKSIEEIGVALKKMSYQTALAFSSSWGWSETFMRSVRSGEFKHWIGVYNSDVRSVGLSNKQLSLSSHQFMDQLRSLWLELSAIGDKVAASVMGGAGGGLKQFNAWLKAHGKQIAAFLTDLARAALKLAKALLKMAIDPKMQKEFTKFMHDMHQLVININAGVKAIGGWKTVGELVAGYFATIWLARMLTAISIVRGAFGTMFPAGMLAFLAYEYGPKIGKNAKGQTTLTPAFNPSHHTMPALAATGKYLNNLVRPSPEDHRNLWQRLAPKVLGGKSAPPSAAGESSPAGHFSLPAHAANAHGSMTQRGLYMMSHLVNKYGWTPQAAAIAVGNAQQESSIRADGPMGDPSTPGGSWGLMQWNRKRLVNLKKYAAQHHEKWRTLDAQIGFLNHEVRGGRLNAWPKAQNMAHADQIGHLYEGFGDNSGGTRVANAGRFLSAWNAHASRAKASSVVAAIQKHAAQLGHALIPAAHAAGLKGPELWRSQRGAFQAARRHRPANME